MGFPIYRLISLGIFLVSWIGLGTPLSFVTEPQPFTFLTKRLNISCIVDELSKSILSIEIMRHAHDKPIAIVNVRKELKMAEGIKDNVKVEGHIDIKSNTGYLSLIIDKPGRQDAGPYRCQLFYIDESLKIDVENVNGNVTYQETAVSEVISDLVEKVSTLLSKVKEQNTHIEKLNKDNTKKQRQLEMLMEYIALQNKTIQKQGLQLKNMAQRLPCLAGWTVYTEDKTCLRLFTKYTTWFQAREACQLFDGDLVEIRDEDKNNFVMRMTTGSLYGSWIGIKNNATRGLDFKYVDGSDLGSYHPWGQGQPEDTGDDDDKCVYMSEHTTHHGTWYDNDCDSIGPYVCSMTSLTVL